MIRGLIARRSKRELELEQDGPDAGGDCAGGTATAGQTNVYLVLASALEVADGQDSGNGVIPLPPEWLRFKAKP